MNLSLSTRSQSARLPISDWTQRCATHIRALDCMTSELEADALAQALWESPGCRIDSPEASAEKVCGKVRRWF